MMRFIGALILVLGAGCGDGGLIPENADAFSPQPDLLVASTPDKRPPPANCTAGPIQNYGGGGEIALTAAQGNGFALAFVTNTEQGNVSALLLLDRNGLVQKTVALGAGGNAQIVHGNFTNTLATFQTGSSGETATGRMDADGGNFRQYRLPQNPSFLSPIFVDSVHGLSRQAWIDVEPNPNPALACAGIKIGETASDGKMGGYYIKSLALRDGRCLSDGRNVLEAFATDYAANIIAVHESPSESSGRLSLFIGHDSTYDRTDFDGWDGNDGAIPSYSFFEQIDRLMTGGFVVPIQRWTMPPSDTAEPVFDRTRLFFFDVNGKYTKTVTLPHFMGYDTVDEGFWTTNHYIATISLDDVETNHTFFHLMDEDGTPLHGLRLGTVENNWNTQAKIVKNNASGDTGYAFFAVWGGGRSSAANSFAPIYGARITCK